MTILLQPEYVCNIPVVITTNYFRDGTVHQLRYPASFFILHQSSAWVREPAVSNLLHGILPAYPDNVFTKQ